MRLMTTHMASAIIPVYNGGRYIAEALASVLAQSYRPMEIIVVDDGSTDDSAEIIRALPGVTYIRQENSGTAVARNTGVAVSRGQWIAFLDQDDRWTPDKLAVQIGFMQNHPVGYTVACERLVVEAGMELPSWLKPELVRKDHAAWLPGTLVVRREVFDVVGLFDTAYSSSSDSDWFFRAKDAGIPMAVLPDVLLEKRIHTANQSYDSTLAGDLLRQVRSSLKRRTESGKENV